MRLGQLIDTLATLPADAEITYDNGEPIGDFASWRGVYAELTLCPTRPYRNGEPRQAPMTVGELLEAAKRADGGTFTGYKGGEFVMSRDTPVWADDYGEYRCRGILSVLVGAPGGKVLLVTADLSDYRA